MATTTSSTKTNGSPRPTDTEVQRARRSWPATYKLQILSEVDAAPRGEIGEILRREGLYSSLISEWRKQRDRGALEGLRERRPGPAGKDPVRVERDRLRDENAELRDHVERCEELIGAQGKAFALLATISTPSSATPSSTRPSR
jgi:transposase-like protein